MWYYKEEIDKIGAMFQACIKLGYTGAGTFEFLYQDGQFSFIEMNTRIQIDPLLLNLLQILI